jgi:hypothetical protein
MTTTIGTYDFKENNAPSPSSVGRRLSVTTAGALELTDTLGITTPVGGGGGGNIWIHNPPVTVGMSPYAASIQETVKVDVDTGVISVTLPSAIGLTGRQLKVLSLSDNISPPVCTVSPTFGQTLNGGPNWTLTTPRERLVVESDGANWLVVD